MRNELKAVFVSAGLLLLVAGCGGGSHGYYDADGRYHTSSYRDRYSDDDHDRYRDNVKKVRVCDMDGDDCHIEYRAR